MAIELVDLSMKNGDVPLVVKSLPKGISWKIPIRNGWMNRSAPILGHLQNSILSLFLCRDLRFSLFWGGAEKMFQSQMLHVWNVGKEHDTIDGVF